MLLTAIRRLIDLAVDLPVFVCTLDAQDIRRRARHLVRIVKLLAEDLPELAVYATIAQAVVEDNAAWADFEGRARRLFPSANALAAAVKQGDVDAAAEAAWEFSRVTGQHATKTVRAACLLIELRQLFAPQPAATASAS